MERNRLLSGGAILAACLVAITVFALAPIVLLFLAGLFPTDYLVLHPMAPFTSTYALSSVVGGVLAGVAAGTLAPARPVVHVLIAVVVLEAVGLVVAGTQLLPHGWEVAGLACQVALAAAVAALTWGRRRRVAVIDAPAL